MIWSRLPMSTPHIYCTWTSPSLCVQISCLLIRLTSMAWCTAAITPLLTHWIYCSLALSHRHLAHQQTRAHYKIWHNSFQSLYGHQWFRVSFCRTNIINLTEWRNFMRPFSTKRHNMSILLHVHIVAWWHRNTQAPSSSLALCAGKLPANGFLVVDQQWGGFIFCLMWAYTKCRTNSRRACFLRIDDAHWTSL